MLTRLTPRVVAIGAMTLALLGCVSGTGSDGLADQVSVAASGGNVQTVKQLASTPELRDLALSSAVGMANDPADFQSHCSIEILEWLLARGTIANSIDENPARSALGSASQNTNCTDEAVDLVLRMTGSELCQATRESLVSSGIESRFMC